MIAHNLPAQATPFIGRTAELDQIAHLLGDPACRLLTLAGPGGIGKTRLALETAQQLLNGRAAAFADGVFFVPPQPIESPEFILSTLANAVGFQFCPEDDPKSCFLGFLREKSLLLVLDNIEHLLEGVGLLSDMLASAPGVKLLVTSRERLNLSAETVFTVTGMRVPETGEAEHALDYSAVKLFLQGARRARPDFKVADDDLPDLARICWMVSGIPLMRLPLASTSHSSHQPSRSKMHSMVTAGGCMT